MAYRSDYMQPTGYKPYQPISRANFRSFDWKRPIEKKNLPNLRQSYYQTRMQTRKPEPIRYG